MYNRLDTIPAINRQTDRQTEGRTDILPRPSPRYAYASRGKTENHTALKLRGEVTHIRSIWQSNFEVKRQKVKITLME